MTTTAPAVPLHPAPSRPPGRRPLLAVARWSATHRWTVLVAWLLLVAGALVAGSAAGTRSLSDADTAVGRSAPAERALARADLSRQPVESVLIRSREGGPADGAVAAVAEQVRARTAALPGVAGVASLQRSADGRSLLVQVTLRTSGGDATAVADEADRLVRPVLAATSAVQAAHPDVLVEQAGSASLGVGLDEVYGDDFSRAELLSVPLTLLVLLLSFGALVAAGVPVLLGLTAVAGALGLSSLASHVVPSTDSTASVVLLVGLAVGVDYSLFYVRREREERAAGRGALDAIETAARTSGRAVLVSGATVAVAMSGMFLAGNALFSSFAVGTILVVAVAVLGSLTVLPAVLALLGNGLDRFRLPLTGRRRTRTRGGLWPRVLRPVLARPAVALALSVAALVALAAPLLVMRTSLPGVDDLPRSVPVVRAYQDLAATFPTSGASHTVAVWSDRPLDRPAVERAVTELAARAAATGQVVADPTGAEVAYSTDGRVAEVDLPLGYSAEDPRATRSLALLRDRLVPATVGALPGVRAGVTGETAGTQDFNAVLRERLPVVIGFVLALTVVVLLLAFRSLALALTAVGLNLLSVGAAYGLLVLVFQHTWAEGLLGFTSTGAVVAWLPLFLFVILFGLSMDYHVFVVSRVREAARRGLPVREAVAEGITRSAGVVTSAALVMVAVFAVFGTLTAIEFKQLGVGLAAAVLLDATLVRGVLLPSAMAVLGERNWWLPRWLQWLPEPAAD